MKIGVPKEIKKNEYRVAVTPAGVAELVNCGHEVYIQQDAGAGSGFSDSEYIEKGAKIADTLESIYKTAELIIKVKEPLREEYNLIEKHHIVFSYFHFASSLELTESMCKSGAVCIAYETVTKSDKSLPLLTPMSEIAGRMSVQEGAKYLEKPMGGRGVLLGGVPGVPPANVIVLGGGIVGANAAKMAAGLGANVTLFDINIDRLRHLSDILPSNVTTIYSNSTNIRDTVAQADLIIGAVLIPGAKAPVLISADMLKLMRPGTVLVDVAVDQGGCIETCRPTTHEAPTYVIDGIVHYCVANMPGAVPHSSTLALTNATLPFILQLANKGWKNAIRENAGLKEGLNIVHGKIAHKLLAESLNLPFEEVG